MSGNQKSERLELDRRSFLTASGLAVLGMHATGTAAAGSATSARGGGEVVQEAGESPRLADHAAIAAALSSPMPSDLVWFFNATP